MPTNIALVDDNHEFLEEFRQLVERAPLNLNLMTFDSVSVFKEFCKNHASAQSPDLAFVDVNLGEEIDGIELTRQVKPLLPNSQFIVLTEASEPMDPYRAGTSGASAFIEKDELLGEQYLSRLMQFQLAAASFLVEYGKPSASLRRKKATRCALLIGVGEYEHVGNLKNPTNDCARLYEKLNELGFDDVTVCNEGSALSIKSKLKEFSRKAQKSDWSLVFYAGHGMEVDGSNYLVPSDAKLELKSDIVHECISLEDLMTSMDGTSSLKLSILDACRNNPFAQRDWFTSNSRASAGGFAAVEPSVGNLVVFSAKHGTTASDGAGANSPYTQALLECLDIEAVDIRFLFDLVRDKVQLLTNGEQLPFSYGSLPAKVFEFHSGYEVLQKRAARRRRT